MTDDTIIVCDRTYTVAHLPMAGALGCCDNQGQSIMIDSDSHPETQASVLVHEVFEAINASMNLNLQHKTISALETAWYGVLTTNEPWWDRHFIDEEEVPA